MKIRLAWSISFLLFSGFAHAQSLQQKLQSAIGRLQADSQCKYASISLTVLDAKTGEKIFTANPNLGLAPASTLKVITSITALNMLGKDFQYQTQFGYTGSISADGTLTGDVVIKGAGDPTLGSWRYEKTKEGHILTQMVEALQKAGVKKINGRIVGDDTIFGSQSVPDGWIWQDVGNYYGAGASGLCWRENQYTIKLKTGAVGTQIGIPREVPAMPYLSFKSELLNAPSGTGDNAYAYLPVGGKTVYLRGTYAADQTKKSIAAALPDPAYDVALRLVDTLNSIGIKVSAGPESSASLVAKGLSMPQATNNLVTMSSPLLSQIIYWQNQKSINLYAEQLLKTIAWKSGKIATTSNGILVEQNFWKLKGIDSNTLNIADGSGLSPGDRVTTLTMATILQSAKKESWFPEFLESLPTHNNIKMKSGTINNVLNFAGYQNKAGRELCFAIMVNNYSGSTSSIREKIFRVMDELK